MLSDPSVLQFAAVSLYDAWQNLKKGGRRRGTASPRPPHLHFLRAVWEDRKYIGGGSCRGTQSPAWF
jgi:hypothetical protein